MRILVFNQVWCVDEFKRAGHDVRTVGMHPECDVKDIPPLVHLNTILSTHLPDFQPDRIVFWDNSAPISVLGIEDTEIPTFFYSVDTHHHTEYHKYLSHVFDKTLIAQRDYINEFAEFDNSVAWMPLWASRFVEPSDQRRHGAVFVGNMDAKLNPDRVKFFEELKAQRELYTTMGEYWNIFPYSEVVVNQTVKGDLNFRVFETLMCGVPLLTEYSENGLFEIFTEGKHLLAYRKADIENVVEKIDWVISHPAQAREIAHAGRQEVLAKHLPIHRAQRVLADLEGLSKKQRLFRRYAMFVNFSVLARRLEKIDTDLAKKALVQAMRIIEDACRAGEPITTEVACHCILGAINYDRCFRSGAGEALIEMLSEAYPNEKVLHLSRIRSLLNRGALPNAKQIAECYFDGQVTNTFRNAETVVATILSDLMR